MGATKDSTAVKCVAEEVAAEDSTTGRDVLEDDAAHCVIEPAKRRGCFEPHRANTQIAGWAFNMIGCLSLKQDLNSGKWEMNNPKGLWRDLLGDLKLMLPICTGHKKHEFSYNQKLNDAKLRPMQPFWLQLRKKPNKSAKQIGQIGKNWPPMWA